MPDLIPTDGLSETDPSPTVVLVVEDEGLIRVNACDMLANMGFEVLDAADGAEALELLETRRDIGLIFSDCRMPRGDGP